MSATSQVVITSYGARWNDPPRHAAPVLLLDVSNRLWDPAARAATQDLVPLTGLDAAVRAYVLSAPGATELIADTGREVLALSERRTGDNPAHLYVHCWYGRHRAVAVAEAVGTWLTTRGITVHTEHRHIGRPLVHRDSTVAETCVFCRIIAGTEPATVVREWDDALAIMPRGGVNAMHTLVIPRRHVDNAVVDPAITALTMARAAELGAELDCDLNLITSVGPLATQTVPHLHIHLLPRAEGDGLPLPWTPQQEASRPHGACALLEVLAPLLRAGQEQR
ncbi:HIT domain-containing protein [Streptomyces sp. NPDC021100]|uniref:RapZ C-terminal domain-containing protein n=1 Tax=Streptomyces sp. NPDC021100 TaxID=3365114 RepID=UPI0037985C72